MNSHNYKLAELKSSNLLLVFDVIIFRSSALLMLSCLVDFMGKCFV